MYKVIKSFTDLKDKCHPYNAGDTFPRKGVKADKERLEELSTEKNKRGVPLIEEVADEKPKRTPKPKAEDKASAE